MNLHFYKFQGAGNDFIILDNRHLSFEADNISFVAGLCDRRFGIGADGLMLLQDHPQHDFEMRYFNSDGREASMCGNGGRCMAAFARMLRITGDKATFMAIDGIHEAIINPDGEVNLRMSDVENIRVFEDGYALNTGSPHFVRFMDSLEELDVEKEGRMVRNNERFAPEGTNVNFVRMEQGLLTVFTYERGVEAETLACGTGITASALCAALKTGLTEGTFQVKAKGGNLSVSFRLVGNRFSDIWLKGPAVFVFEGFLPV